MSCLHHLFSVEELEALDEKQLAILDALILREIQTNPDLRDMLREKLKREVYDRWLAERRPQRARRARPPRTPE
jgi:hypothetical protein